MVWIRISLALILLLFQSSYSNTDSHSTNRQMQCRQHCSFYIKLEQDPVSGKCTILQSSSQSTYRGFHPHRDAQTTLNDTSNEGLNVVSVYAKTGAAMQNYISCLCNYTEPLRPLLFPAQGPVPEILKLVDGGSSLNRIDVVFMGDGYTQNERMKFFTDMQRLTSDMFEGVTFKSYLPLFNIWAIFVPSNESGIGYDGPKNTPFRLYREKGQLRVIYTANANYARQVCALVGESGCDFPSLIANDDYYGGVGGEFVISTRSLRTGTFVLRHEMGHSFIEVGDEYDNSWAYFGANTADSLDNVGWTHWLSDTPVQEQRSIYRLLEYPWVDLGNGSVQTYHFTSDGSFHRWHLAVSVSAAGEEGSLELSMDGSVLPWASRGSDDREFYYWDGIQGFATGNHTLTVKSITTPTHPSIPRMICSITLYEYGNEIDFHMDSSYISAYPTWDDQRRKHYRPTNTGCLMRNVTHDQLCPICKEEMWIQFLARVSLIDDLQISSDLKNATLHTIKLGQLRQPGNEIEGEYLTVRWYLNQQEQPELRDQFEIQVSTGAWRVVVQLSSLEVRKDELGLLSDEIEFAI